MAARRLNPPRRKKVKRPKRVVYLGGSFAKVKAALNRSPDDEAIKKWQKRSKWRREVLYPTIALIIAAAIIGFAVKDAYDSTHPQPKGQTHVSDR